MVTFAEESKRWADDKGDLTHRLDYSLHQNSVVIDIGGYKGAWSEAIYNKYKCYIYIYEPITDFYKELVEKFKGNRNINMYNVGVGESAEELVISIDGGNSSLYKREKQWEVVKIMSINTILRLFCPVDLMKINIEGGEYDLLESIHPENIKKIGNLQIQFHNFIPEAETRRNKIRNTLSLTHECTYNYEFVWENWTLKQ